EPGTTATVPLDFPAVRGRTVRLVIQAVRPVTTIDYYSEHPIELPVGIADLGTTLEPTLHAAGIDTGCRDDLVTVDGRAVPLRVIGTADEGLDRRGLTLQSCGPPLNLASGHHLLRSARGRDTGI